jgi:nicotinamidase-related amidase
MPQDLAAHAWRIAAREYRRHEARRGRRYAYESLDPGRTALVVVDMVPFFLDGSAYARGIVPPLNRLAAALRAAGGTVAWVIPATGAPRDWAVEFYGPGVAATYAASGGGPVPVRDRVAPALDVRDGDLWAEKSASGAFFPGRSTLPDQLAARGVDTVIVGGTVTSVCCESTARDAATLGFRVVFLADGTADVSDAAHNATLRTVYRSFGDVRPTDDVLGLLSRRA